MQGLIVAILSVSVVAALAAASIFYGGSAFLGSSARAHADALINGGMQIAASEQLYMSEMSGQTAGTISELILHGGLATRPEIPKTIQDRYSKHQFWSIALFLRDWDPDAHLLAVAGIADEQAEAICAAIEETGGVKVTPGTWDEFLGGAPRFGCAELEASGKWALVTKLVSRQGIFGTDPEPLLTEATSVASAPISGGSSVTSAGSGDTRSASSARGDAFATLSDLSR